MVQSEWYDANFIKANIPNGQTIVTNGLRSNPNMSKAKAIPYIDTICQYVAPRMAISLGLISDYRMSIGEASFIDASVFPNLTTGKVKVSASSEIISIELADIVGKSVRYLRNFKDQSNIEIDFTELKASTYLIIIQTEKGQSTAKLMKE